MQADSVGESGGGYFVQTVVHADVASASDSIGSCEAIQALMPPARSLTFLRPAAANKLAAIAER